jgi:hypothetical protein
MSIQAPSFARRPQLLANAKIVPDRRKYKRFAMVLLGRFMRQDKREYPCKLVDISVGGAALSSPVVPHMDERIITYFDQLGGLEGKVVRIFDGGFAVAFTATQHKREKLAAQLTWLINKQELGGPEDRRHERVTLRAAASTLTLADGVTVPCRVLDVSLSGASIGTMARPEIGSDVLLGKLRARVVRRHDQGIGVQFLDIQEPEALRRYFG